MYFFLDQIWTTSFFVHLLVGSISCNQLCGVEIKWSNLLHHHTILQLFMKQNCCVGVARSFVYGYESSLKQQLPIFDLISIQLTRHPELDFGIERLGTHPLSTERSNCWPDIFFIKRLPHFILVLCRQRSRFAIVSITKLVIVIYLPENDATVLSSYIYLSEFPNCLPFWRTSISTLETLIPD